MNCSNYLEESILNYYFRNQPQSQPPSVYLGLFKTNPQDNNTGTEINGTGYSRQLVTFGAPTQQLDKAQITNSGRIEFPTAQSEWGEVAYFGIYDSRTSGNLLVWGTFSKPTNIQTGNKFIIDNANLTINLG